MSQLQDSVQFRSVGGKESVVDASERLLPDDFAREVYCVVGLPIDAIDMETVVRRIDAAAADRIPFFLSTPNANFLVASRIDRELRESVLDSDLCPPDGMSVIWIARLLGLPITERVSGADILDALRRESRRPQLSAFLFGGSDAVGAAAQAAFNVRPTGLRCIATMNPGFGTVEDMSREQVLQAVNASGADFVMASLGARKGQLWLHRNRNRLTIPVRAHFGAAMNFAAGSIKRAPRWFQKTGLEWLWRIKEEPYLWRRYAYDGWAMLILMLTRILPLAILNRLGSYISRVKQRPLVMRTERVYDTAILRFSGDACERYIQTAIDALQTAPIGKVKTLRIDLRHVRVIDARFFGFFLMLRKRVKMDQGNLEFVGVSPMTRLLFRLQDLGFLLKQKGSHYRAREPRIGNGGGR
jgi:N-acetylglucosaminyldiphosphoundecaprenol N-acetyl-beta-D-mannosaminyltransferase